jgi:hypothetical protein
MAGCAAITVSQESDDDTLQLVLAMLACCRRMRHHINSTTAHSLPQLLDWCTQCAVDAHVARHWSATAAPIHAQQQPALAQPAAQQACRYWCLGAAQQHAAACSAAACLWRPGSHTTLTSTSSTTSRRAWLAGRAATPPKQQRRAHTAAHGALTRAGADARCVVRRWRACAPACQLCARASHTLRRGRARVRMVLTRRAALAACHALACAGITRCSSSSSSTTQWSREPQT